ncbi:MAG: hypothetical protein Q4E74_02795 [Ruminococcus sp.]|nr:hypothetical protein [Ruminococcus sp.]
MDAVKTAIFTACIMGVISMLADIAAPEGSSKNQLNIILGIITLLAVMTPFTDGGFRLSLDEFSFDEQSAYYDRKLEYSTDNAILDSACDRYEEYFMEKLNSNDIKVSRIDFQMSINEDEISADKAVIYLSDYSQQDAADSLIKEDLPQIETEYISEEQNEIRDRPAQN